MLFALVALAVPPGASADDWSPILHCGNDSCVLIDVGNVPTDPQIAIYVYRTGSKKYGSSELLDTLDFSKECEWTGNGNDFKCRANPRNPLSGATYRQFELGSSKTCGEIDATDEYEFRCVDNCQRAPHTLDVDPACD